MALISNCGPVIRVKNREFSVPDTPFPPWIFNSWINIHVSTHCSRLKNQELKDAEGKLKELQSQPTNADAEHEMSELEVTVKGLEQRLHKLSNEQNLVSKEASS